MHACEAADSNEPLSLTYGWATTSVDPKFEDCQDARNYYCIVEDPPTILVSFKPYKSHVARGLLVPSEV